MNYQIRIIRRRRPHGSFGLRDRYARAGVKIRDDGNAIAVELGWKCRDRELDAGDGEGEQRVANGEDDESRQRNQYDRDDQGASRILSSERGRCGTAAEMSRAPRQGE